MCSSQRGELTVHSWELRIKKEGFISPVFGKSENKKLMRQLSWEFFFIYSNPGKIMTTQKISTYELIFFLMMMNKFLKSTIIEKFA